MMQEDINKAQGGRMTKSIRSKWQPRRSRSCEGYVSRLDKEFFLNELHCFGTKPLRFNRSKADTGFIVHRELQHKCRSLI